ncbi:sugar membrane transport protein [Salmonella bongori]|nr:sugar membrane transport protein [Salmonella bongori]
MFAVVAFGLLVCWSNAVGGLILAQLKALGWTDNSTTATFSAITTAGMFLGALVGGIIGDKTGRRNAFILYEANPYRRDGGWRILTEYELSDRLSFW